MGSKAADKYISDMCLFINIHFKPRDKNGVRQAYGIPVETGGY
jgi:hypothetical protein